MHNSAFRTAKLFFDNYCKADNHMFICELGSQIYRTDENCPMILRDAVPSNSVFIGLDFAPGEGVDVVLQDPYKFPFEDNTFDFLITSSCFEHSEMFWLTFLEGMRILKPSGVMYCNAPSGNMPYHKYPVDCWRFFPDAGQALENWARRNGMNVKMLETYIINPTFEKPDDFVYDWVCIFVKDERYAHLHPNRIKELDNYERGLDAARMNSGM